MKGCVWGSSDPGRVSNRPLAKAESLIKRERGSKCSGTYLNLGLHAHYRVAEGAGTGLLAVSTSTTPTIHVRSSLSFRLLHQAIVALGAHHVSGWRSANLVAEVHGNRGPGPAIASTHHGRSMWDGEGQGHLNGWPGS